MKYVIITKIPSRKGALGPIAARNVIEETEAPDLETLKAGLYIPPNGECLVIEEEHVVTVKEGD